MLHPIKIIDIQYTDLAYGYAACANLFLNQKTLLDDIGRLWESQRKLMVTLSVRSGFYLLLKALALPVGSEVIMSGITIPDMPRIVEAHGLKVVPIDLSMRDLRIDEKKLTDAITDKTRMVVVAHLYGATIDMQPVCDVLAQHPDIVLVEDCAQAFSGLNGYRGHEKSDVLMYSFGTIKTSTALGGGAIFINDSTLYNQMSHIHHTWPMVSRKEYAKKLSKGLVLKMASMRVFLKLFIFYCYLTQQKIDKAILRIFRGFPGDDFFRLICRRPSLPLLALLKRRLQTFEENNFIKRIERFNFVKQYLQPGVFVHGVDNPRHTNWVCAVSPGNVEHFVQSIRKLGVFCFLGSPQIEAICATTSGNSAQECAESMKNVVYVPIANNMSDAMLKEIAEVMNQYAY